MACLPAALMWLWPKIKFCITGCWSLLLSELRYFAPVLPFDYNPASLQFTKLSPGAARYEGFCQEEWTGETSGYTSLFCFEFLHNYCRHHPHSPICLVFSPLELSYIIVTYVEGLKIHVLKLLFCQHLRYASWVQQSTVCTSPPPGNLSSGLLWGASFYWYKLAWTTSQIWEISFCLHFLRPRYHQN